MSFEWLTDPQIWIALLTLTFLEIILGIDNIIFISILSSKLPKEQQPKARKLGLGVALISRIILLMGLAWVVRLEKPFWEPSFFAGTPIAFELAVSGRDLILLIGGLFLLAKATYEIHERLEGEEGEHTKKVAPTFAAVLLQIMLLDVVFSLDSVITAVGMVKQIPVMVAAVMISMGVMLLFVNQISEFVDRHPTIKMLALSFLILIGCVLVAEGFHHHVPKGYVYFAMAFSVAVEFLNIKAGKAAKIKAVKLHEPYR